MLPVQKIQNKDVTIPMKTLKNDTQKLVGRILGDDQRRRDAVHCAIMPVTAADDCLQPGQRVKIVRGTESLVTRARGPEYEDPGIGIVDPFLMNSVRKGQRFFLFLPPCTITGLYHEWTHPLIDGRNEVSTPRRDQSTSESERWLRAFARKWNFNYKVMVAEASAKTRGKGRHAVIAKGTELSGRKELGEDHDLFWDHLEKLTRQTFGEEHRMNLVWSCSC